MIEMLIKHYSPLQIIGNYRQICIEPRKSSSLEKHEKGGAVRTICIQCVSFEIFGCIQYFSFGLRK